MKRLLAALTMLAACSSSDLEPRSGTWNYGGSDLVNSTCKGEVPTDPDGSFTLMVTGDGTLTVEDGDFDEPFACTFDGDEYTCPSRAAGSAKVDNIDATLFYEVSVKGTFASETELSGTQVVKLTCEGASCELGAQLYGYTLPCEYSYTFDATAQ